MTPKVKAAPEPAPMSYEEQVLKEVQADVKKVLLGLVLKNTPGLDPAGVKMPVEAPKDPKVKAVEDALKSACFNHDNDRDQVAKILSALMGVELDFKPLNRSSLVHTYTLAVPMTSIDSHNYTVGNVCMFRSDGGNHAMEVVKGKTRVGNSFPTKYLGDNTNVRFPSKAEAVEFVGKLVSSLENIQAVRSWVRDLDTYLDKV